MAMCTTRHQVTFTRPFHLSGLNIHPAGSYTVTVAQEQLGAVSRVGWRQLAATLQCTRGGMAEHVPIDMQDLREALLRDSGQSTDPPSAPAMARAQNPRMRELLRLQGRLL